MSDLNNINNNENMNGEIPDNDFRDSGFEDVYSSSESTEATAEAESAKSYEPAPKTEEIFDSGESSYEWNSGTASALGEYRHSYINGNNSSAPHNPNNYDSAYSRPDASQSYYQSGSGYQQRPYGGHYYQNPSGASNRYGSQNTSAGYAAGQQSAGTQSAAVNRGAAKPQKERKPVSRKFVAAALAVTLLGSTALGFGGGMLASSMNSTPSQTVKSADGKLTINQTTSDSGNSKTVSSSSGTTATTTSEIVKKTADSVVEIVTEQTVTGGFAQQYVQKGAGSGVIISNEDGVGYIVTNQHVIDGASNIEVTLRDAATKYTAELVGSDKDNDVALLKVEASGLSVATFGDSSKLAVGDYVVAIGNPLGTLGGTVTDGIISALAREVTIENRNMTLLQTNAQISPGNSGGGLFNANGELIGIVNAKDSATEVEGIAFAIPVNKVVDVIKDLKDYGYVTGKIDLGMEFVDINSRDTAFYYGVSETGCYVLSVTSGSNAEKAGFMRGDIIKSVNGTEVSSSSEIDKVLKDAKVGDTVKFVVSHSGKEAELSLKLAEYVPSAEPNEKDSETYREYQSDDLWSRLFDW